MEIENRIAENPTYWPIVSGTGGVRKARAARPGRGKSGGLRIIYYFVPDPETIYLIMAYAKNDKSDLEPQDKAAIKAFIGTL